MTETHEFWIQFMESQLTSIRNERILTKKELAVIEAKVESVRNMTDEQFEAFKDGVDKMHRDLEIKNVLDNGKLYSVDQKWFE